MAHTARPIIHQGYCRKPFPTWRHHRHAGPMQRVGIVVLPSKCLAPLEGDAGCLCGSQTWQPESRAFCVMWVQSPLIALLSDCQ